MGPGSSIQAAQTLLQNTFGMFELSPKRHGTSSASPETTFSGDILIANLDRTKLLEMPRPQPLGGLLMLRSRGTVYLQRLPLLRL